MTGTSSSKATVAFSLAPYNGLGDRKEQRQDVKIFRDMRAEVIVNTCRLCFEEKRYVQKLVKQATKNSRVRVCNAKTREL